MGFGLAKDGLHFQDNDIDDKNDGEVSSDNQDEMLGAKKIDHDSEIKGLYYSKSNSMYGYLVIVANMRFTIKYIYDEQMQGCEID